MGKRQKRIFRKDIQAHTQELLLHRSVQVVLRSKAVVNGDIVQLTADELHLEDHRFGRHIIPMSDIEEVIYDIVAAW